MSRTPHRRFATRRDGANYRSGCEAMSKRRVVGGQEIAARVADGLVANLSQLEIVEYDFSGLEMFDVRFDGSRLVRCNFSKAVASQAQFVGTEISDCVFDGATLVGAMFFEARVIRGTFRMANLIASEWLQSKLEDCDYTNADLSGASFSDCTMNRLRFGGARASDLQVTGGVSTDVSWPPDFRYDP